MSISSTHQHCNHWIWGEEKATRNINYKMLYCFNFEEEADLSRPKNNYSKSQVLEFNMKGGCRRSVSEMYNMNVEKIATRKSAEKIQLPTI